MEEAESQFRPKYWRYSSCTLSSLY